MMRVIVNGALGHMGRIVADLVKEQQDMEIAALVDPRSESEDVLASLWDVKGKADIVIDFSHHSSVVPMLDWCEKTGTCAVIATTGHDEKERGRIKAASLKIPVFFAANMSVGIALLADMARRAAAVFPNADIEIVESHHNRKLDAPSGTALFLAQAVRTVRPDAVLHSGRTGMAKREPNEIGIHSLRLGNIPGMHEVIINTGTQSLTLKHEVYDRALFAEGAIVAARYLYGKAPGMYDMQTMLG
ncbi:MAG: 4-hydroxy-tetrahydrodipicolinate reductase [Clostridia bacterium]|nr:4-hydroxy-tetrahydrodipicolinate reductase [Clostridia bacterium]